MKTIMVQKGVVLETLEKNRVLHLKEYKEAMKNWAEMAITQLKDEIKELENHPEDANLYFNLQKPESHVDDYDKAIGMMKFEVRDEVEITEEDYSRFFLDEWNWSDGFKHLTTVYNSRSG